MISLDAVHALITINGATLVVVLAFGFRFARHMGRIETMFGMLWSDYKERKGIKE